VRLENKTAIITGAAGGIGAAIAHAFARESASVVCVDINGEVLQQVVNKIEAQGGKAQALEADIGKETTAREAVALATKTYGKLNVAGLKRRL